jgi:glutaminyl-peptide cyclotransferase
LRFRRGALIRRSQLAAGVAATLALGCGREAASSSPALRPPTPVSPIEIVAVRPHDATAFTQGLVWADGKLFESLGGYGASALREVDPSSGKVLREVRLPESDFGEGIALVGDRLLQMTWQEGRLHVWSRRDFAPLATIAYTGETWGLAWDGARLAQTDGSAFVRFRDPTTFRELSRVRVLRDDRPVAYLNELEWAGGWLYANVWQSDEILRIDPTSGRVAEAFDASNLLSPAERAEADVLNGIAWDPQRRLFLITGKLWPKLFEVRLGAGPP